MDTVVSPRHRVHSLIIYLPWHCQSVMSLVFCTLHKRVSKSDLRSAYLGRVIDGRVLFKCYVGYNSVLMQSELFASGRRSVKDRCRLLPAMQQQVQLLLKAWLSENIICNNFVALRLEHERQLRSRDQITPVVEE